jgi:hypothetical protein
MRVKIGCLALLIVLATAAAAAQQAPRVPNANDIYCSGVVTIESVPSDTYLISGEQSNYKITFSQGDLVYVNKGSGQGAKVGDEFQVMRAIKDPVLIKWFSQQPGLLRAMGTTYADLGRLRVVSVQSNVSTAEIVYACDYVQRGDIVRPFAERPAPPFKESAQFDRFAPVSGKSLAMVVTTKNFGQQAGTNSVVYVNLGSGQGVKVGDYFRVFRHQGTHNETAFQVYGTAYKMYGFGSAPRTYKWDDLPREILGEGIVLRVSPNASTVLITLSLREIYVGDYVEIE